jgi:hypothetical protein
MPIGEKQVISDQTSRKHAFVAKDKYCPFPWLFLCLWKF